MSTTELEIRELFPFFPLDQVQRALLKYDNDFERAVDYLLTNSFDVERDVESDYESDNYDHGRGTFAAFDNDSEEEDEVGEYSESRHGSESFESKVSQIRSLLPDIDEDVVERALKYHDNNMEIAIDYLMENNGRIPPESESPQESVSFNTLQDPKINKICELTEISEQDAIYYYNKNSRNGIETLVDIINSYKGNKNIQGKDTYESGLQAATRGTHIPQGGKVQSNNSNNNTKSINSSSDQIDKEPYVYSESNPEVIYLGEIVSADKTLVNISWEFYINCLIYFEGEISKVLELVFFIIEKDGIEATYKETKLDYSQIAQSKKLTTKNSSKVTGKRQTRQLPSVSLPQKSYTPSASSTNRREDLELDGVQLSLQRRQLHLAKQEDRIDLHHFNVKNAKFTCSKALDEWWSDELKMREDVGKTEPGKIARLLEPFIIITGRGIHSDGGISKVRQAINAMLNKSPYIYDEPEVGVFKVRGRKNRGK